MNAGSPATGKLGVPFSALDAVPDSLRYGPYESGYLADTDIASAASCAFCERMFATKFIGYPT